MKPLRFERHLRLHDLEGFLVREDYLGPTVCFLLIVDHGRPTTLDDFPYMKGIEDPDEYGRNNYIQAIALHDRPLSKEEKEEIANLAGMFLEGIGDHDWNIVFEPLPAEEMRRVERSLEDMLAVFERVLRQHGVSIDLSQINWKSFARLSQD
jgi:hypothetical protein